MSAVLQKSIMELRVYPATSTANAQIGTIRTLIQRANRARVPALVTKSQTKMVFVEGV